MIYIAVLKFMDNEYFKLSLIFIKSFTYYIFSKDVINYFICSKGLNNLLCPHQKGTIKGQFIILNCMHFIVSITAH